MNLVERLRQEYQDATHPMHNTLSLEPRYECEYCGEVELAPNCHAEGCLILLLDEAADEIERLRAALLAGKLLAEDAYKTGYQESSDMFSLSDVNVTEEMDLAWLEYKKACFT